MPSSPALTAPPADAIVPSAAQCELLRALGAVALTPPPDNQHLCDALELPQQSGVDHTDTFILSLPPHAAIHLGQEGKLGGEGLDRVSGFWRALRLDPPEDADHLGTLLMLYAELGDAERGATSEQSQAQLRLAREALFFEHIWSWAPGYLSAVAALDIATTASWAALTRRALDDEAATLTPRDRLPLALRSAAPVLETDASTEDTLDALVAPVRSGAILTHRDLAACASASDLGIRRGERRYALKFLLQQDRPATLSWLAAHAQSWSEQHQAGAQGADAVSSWWAGRAARTADVLAAMSGAPTPRVVH